MRHLLRNHRNEPEVEEALEFPVKSKQRKQAICMIRNDSNFDLFLRGTVRPKKQTLQDAEKKFYPCIYCKAIYTKTYLRRHCKTCEFRTSPMEVNVVGRSQTLIAYSSDPTNAISKLEVNEQVSFSSPMDI